MNLKGSMISLSIFMSLRNISALIKCREKVWELERQRRESRSLFEMDGWGGCSSKTIRPGHKPFPFLLCPSLLLLPLDSFSFLSIFLQERTFSKCCSEKCQKYSFGVLYFCCCIKHNMKKWPTKCSLFLITPCTPILNQVLQGGKVQWTRQTSLIHSRNRMLLGQYKSNCALQNVLKSLLGINLLFCSQRKAGIEWIWNTHSVMNPAKLLKTSVHVSYYYK